MMLPPQHQSITTMKLATNSATTWHQKAIATLNYKRTLHANGLTKVPLQSPTSVVNPTPPTFSQRRWGMGPISADSGTISCVEVLTSLKDCTLWHSRFQMPWPATLPTFHNWRTIFCPLLRELLTFSSHRRLAYSGSVLGRMANLKQTREVKWNVPSQGNKW